MLPIVASELPGPMATVTTLPTVVLGSTGRLVTSEAVVVALGAVGLFAPHPGKNIPRVASDTVCPARAQKLRRLGVFGRRPLGFGGRPVLLSPFPLLFTGLTLMSVDLATGFGSLDGRALPFFLFLP